MPKNILPKVRTLLPSSLVVRALVSEGPRFHCGNCGDVMFVRGASGLCPMCFNDRKPWAAALDHREVHPEMVLAGILDDPSIEYLGAMLPGGAAPPRGSALSLRD